MKKLIICLTLILTTSCVNKYSEAFCLEYAIIKFNQNELDNLLIDSKRKVAKNNRKFKEMCK